MCLNAGNDLTYLTADLYLAAQKLLGLRHCLTGDDLAYLELHFREIVIFDLCLGLDINGFLLCFFSFCICFFRFMLRCCLDHGFFQLCLFFRYILHIQTCEEDFGLVGYFAAALIQTELLQLVKISQRGVQLFCNSLCCLGHIGL